MTTLYMTACVRCGRTCSALTTPEPHCGFCTPHVCQQSIDDPDYGGCEFCGREDLPTDTGICWLQIFDPEHDFWRPSPENRHAPIFREYVYPDGNGCLYDATQGQPALAIQ